jgi:UDP-N-acetylglucosamine--N-acetylmuramyl-(pentapeptide) pyrophosphoryl-undecaprenol N-acetylglucosamine transferase
MKILMAGGGTGGPVAPMIAVAQELLKKDPSTQFVFVGTKNGPERLLLDKVTHDYDYLPAVKYRRYFSLLNFFDIFIFPCSLLKSYFILRRHMPDAIFTVGGFIAVPLCWIAWLMKKPIIVHQQDVAPGLANRLVAPLATLITVALEDSLKLFYTHFGIFKKEKIINTEWVGNPVRSEFYSKEAPNKSFFNLLGQLPVLLVFGGASGSEQINSVLLKALPNIIKNYEVVHVAGKGKKSQFIHPNYHCFEFLAKEMPDIMKLADVVVCRAGLSTISELSFLGKVSVIVPMPDSHQEQNAKVLQEKNAAFILYNNEFTPKKLSAALKDLKYDHELRTSLSSNIKAMMPNNAAEKIAELILKHAKK